MYISSGKAGWLPGTCDGFFRGRCGHLPSTEQVYPAGHTTEKGVTEVTPLLRSSGLYFCDLVDLSP